VGDLDGCTVGKVEGGLVGLLVGCTIGDLDGSVGLVEGGSVGHPGYGPDNAAGAV